MGRMILTDSGICRSLPVPPAEVLDSGGMPIGITRTDVPNKVSPHRSFLLPESLRSQGRPQVPGRSDPPPPKSPSTGHTRQ